MTHPTEHTCCGNARQLIADHLDLMAGYYPEGIFTEDGHTPDAVAGTALRTVLTNEAERLRCMP